MGDGLRVSSSLDKVYLDKNNVGGDLDLIDGDGKMDVDSVQHSDDKLNAESDQKENTTSKSQIVYNQLSDLQNRPEVQRAQIMRQLDSSISMDNSFWHANTSKCNYAASCIVNLLDRKNNTDLVRSAALC